MTTEHQHEQQERRETVLNDARLRQQRQGSTFSQFAQAEADIHRGRFTGHEKSTVIGSTPLAASQYPAGPIWGTADQAPEPSLGVDINEMQPTGEVFEVERSIAAQDAPTLGPVCLHSPAQAPPSTPDASSQLAPLVTDVERGVEGFSSGGPAAQSDFSKTRR
jgi:hypothetical protein